MAGVESHSGIGAAFRAVAVHNVGADLRDSAHDMPEHGDIAWPYVAAHGKAADAECKRWREFSQNIVSARTAGITVGDQPNAVSACDLFPRQIEHMAEQAADWRAKDVQNVQGGHCGESSPEMLAAGIKCPYGQTGPSH
jgi:hypothetical protein